MAHLKLDLMNLSNVIGIVSRHYDGHDNIRYNDVIESLRHTLTQIDETHKTIGNSFLNLSLLENKKLSKDFIRTKRSVLPFVGNAFSFLFGTVSEDDLYTIRRNVKTLITNQKNIIHVTKEFLVSFQLA